MYWLTTSALLLAAVSPTQDPEALRRTVFQGVTEVNLVNIEVTVTDRQGKPVTGLDRDDFLVRENGKPVEVTNFFAVEDDAFRPEPVPADSATAGEDELDVSPPPETKARSLLIYVDKPNLAASHRARVFSSLQAFLLESLPPGTQVMVVANDDGTLRVRQPLTPVLHDVFYALEQIQGEASVASRFDLEEREILRAMDAVNVELGAGGGETGFFAIKGDESPDHVEAEARSILPRIESYCEQRRQHAVASLAVLSRFVDLVVGLPGRRALLYVSDGLELQPGVALLEAYERRFAQVGSVGADAHADTIAARYDSSQALDALLARASTGQITFYSLDATGPAALDRGSAATQASSGGIYASWNDSYASTREEERQQALRRLADETGGRVALSPTAFDALFQGLADDFANRYSLGYVAERSGADIVRQIEVSLREPRPGWTVRHRRSYRELSPSERAEERTQTALLVDDVGNTLEIASGAGPPVPHEEGGFVVPLLVEVPLDKLALTPGPEAHQAQVALFVAVRDDLGRTSPVSRHLCPIRIPNNELLTALGQRAVCGIRLRMRGGAQRVGVTILDEIASIASTTHLELDPSTADAGEAVTP